MTEVNSKVTLWVRDNSETVSHPFLGPGQEGTGSKCESRKGTNWPWWGRKPERGSSVMCNRRPQESFEGTLIAAHLSLKRSLQMLRRKRSTKMESRGAKRNQSGVGLHIPMRPCVWTSGTIFKLCEFNPCAGEAETGFSRQETCRMGELPVQWETLFQK